MISTAVILAAGRGSRLKAITNARSKAMAPVVGMPLIARIISSLRGAGITRFHIVTAPRDDELREYFAEDSAIAFYTQDEPLGSGDALQRCYGHVSGAFLVCACDSLVTSEDIAALMQASNGVVMAAGVMEVSPEVSLESRSVVVLKDDRIVDIIEKPQASERVSNITSLPLYVLKDEIFVELERLPKSPRGEYELPQAIRNCIAKGAPVAYSRIRRRDDVTTLADLLSLNIKVLDQSVPGVYVSEGTVVPSTASLVPPVYIDEQVSIGEGAILGPSVYLERGSAVEAGVRLERVVVTRGGRATRDSHDEVVVAVS